jgi:antibiotic biosynthesis monooxygenase (ABM) superfamily enzyme
MEAFFRAGHAVAPPLWKMALVTWLGVDVAVYVFSNVIPALVMLPGLLSMLVVNAFVVAALTWVIMPLLTRLFGGWLSRSP